MTMSSATTMKRVRALERESDDPHDQFSLSRSQRRRFRRRAVGKAQGNQGHTAVQAEHLFDQIVVEFAS